MAGQVAVCCDMCGRGFHTDKDVVHVESTQTTPSASTATAAAGTAFATSLPSPAAAATSAVTTSPEIEPTTPGLETRRSGNRASIRTRIGTETRASIGTRARSAEDEVVALATMLQYHASQPLHTRTHRPSSALVQVIQGIVGLVD